MFKCYKIKIILYNVITFEKIYLHNKHYFLPRHAGTKQNAFISIAPLITSKFGRTSNAKIA